MIAWPLWRAIRPPAGERDATWAIYLLALFSTVTVVISGASPHFSHASFVPLMPLLASLLALLCDRLRLPALAVLSIVILQAGWAWLATDQRAMVAAQERVAAARAIAPILIQHTAPDALIATYSAGALAYFTDRRTLALDETGAIAAPPPGSAIPRDQVEGALAWRPDIILPSSPTSTLADLWMRDRALVTYPLVRFFYPLKTITPSGDATGSTAIRYFEFDRDDRSFWPTGWSHRDEAADLVEAAADYWSAEMQGPPPDPSWPPSAHVLELQEAQRLAGESLQRGEIAEARGIIDAALARESGACLANLATIGGQVAAMQGDWFRVIQLYKRALRCDPNDTNQMRQRHMRTFLRLSPEQTQQQ
jgi:hypothetical protein